MYHDFKFFDTSLTLSLAMLEMYVHDIEVGTTVLEGKPEVVNETSATALVEGNNLLGPVSAVLNYHSMYMLWFNFSSCLNFFKPVHFFQTSLIFSNQFITFLKPLILYIFGILPIITYIYITFYNKVSSPLVKFFLRMWSFL